MKTLLLFTFGLFCHALTAQITLNQSENAPAAGTTYDYIVAYGDDIGDEIGIFNMDFGGPNGTWDLSSISGETTPAIFGNPSEGNDSEFLTSDYVQFSSNPIVSGERYISIIDGDYFYDGVSVFMPGEDEPLVRTTYEDKRQFMTYPITYLDEFSDTFSGTVEIAAGAQTLTQTGSTALIADGYGTLILPYGTIENVLRIKEISSSFDDFMGITLASNSDYQYYWYHEDYETIIASYEEFYTDGALVDRIASYITEQDFSSLVENYSAPKVSVYPNPSSDIVNFEFPSLQNLNFTIVDSQGKTVLTGSVEASFNNTLTINNLSAGLYIIKGANNKKSFSTRFIIE
ncbi:MAG: T9SS type A sorting domain-containing protein [Flavobacteriales bacterium]